MPGPFGSHRYIVVEGPIGVGKTTLVRRLAPYARARVVMEIFEENPFLEKFYQDRSRYAFQTELFFLLSRYRQQQQLDLEQQGLFHDLTISDYLFHKNLIFSGITLEEAEWKLYLDVYEALEPQIPRPDLLVLLDAPLPVLLERIRRRGRHYEANFDADYLDTLARRYRKEFQHGLPYPVLHVDTTHLDFSVDDAAVELLIAEIARTTDGHRLLDGKPQPKAPAAPVLSAPA